MQMGYSMRRERNRREPWRVRAESAARGVTRRVASDSWNLILRNFRRSMRRLRVPRPSGALRGIGVGIRNGIFRRLLDGFVERRLFRPDGLSHGVSLR